MPDNSILNIGKIAGLEELGGAPAPRTGSVGAVFSEALTEAVQTVDRLQHESEAAQAAFAGGEEVDLHDVLIKIEQAEIAFKAMMEVRSKLVDAYREVMRMGSGG